MQRFRDQCDRDLAISCVDRAVLIALRNSWDTHQGDGKVGCDMWQTIHCRRSPIQKTDRGGKERRKARTYMNMYKPDVVG